MKTVKDPAALKDLALKTGAKVTSDSGQQFNTGKRQAKPARRMEPEVPLKKAEPPPKPAEADLGSVKISETIVDVSRANVKMLQEIKQQIADIKMGSSEPITHWEFEFIRDDRGYLVRLVANGAAPMKVLN